MMSPRTPSGSTDKMNTGKIRSFSRRPWEQMLGQVGRFQVNKEAQAHRQHDERDDLTKHAEEDSFFGRLLISTTQQALDK